MNFTTEYNTLLRSRDFDSAHLPTQEEIAKHLRQESIQSTYSELALPDELRDKIVEVMSKVFARANAEPGKVNTRVTFQLAKLKDATLTASPEKFIALKQALVIILLKFAKATSTPDPELEGLSGNEAAFIQQQKYKLQRQLDEQRRQQLNTASATTTAATTTETATITTTTATELATATTTTTTETATATTATALSQLTVAIEETTTKIEVQRELPADESTEETASPRADILKLFEEDATRFDENGVAIKPSEFLNKLDSPSFQKRDAWMRCINNRTPPATIKQTGIEPEVQA